MAREREKRGGGGGGEEEVGDGAKAELNDATFKKAKSTIINQDTDLKSYKNIIGQELENRYDT